MTLCQGLLADRRIRKFARANRRWTSKLFFCPRILDSCCVFICDFCRDLAALEGAQAHIQIRLNALKKKKKQRARSSRKIMTRCSDKVYVFSKHDRRKKLISSKEIETSKGVNKQRQSGLLCNDKTAIIHCIAIATHQTQELKLVLLVE